MEIAEEKHLLDDKFNYLEYEKGLLDKTLEEFNLDKLMKGGTGQLNGKLSWPKSPWKFDKENTRRIKEILKAVKEDQRIYFFS